MKERKFQQTEKVWIEKKDSYEYIWIEKEHQPNRMEKQTENEKFNWIHLFNDIEQNFVCILLKFI